MGNSCKTCTLPLHRARDGQGSPGDHLRTCIESCCMVWQVSFGKLYILCSGDIWLIWGVVENRNWVGGGELGWGHALKILEVSVSEISGNIKQDKISLACHFRRRKEEGNEGKPHVLPCSRPCWSSLPWSPCSFPYSPCWSSLSPLIFHTELPLPPPLLAAAVITNLIPIRLLSCSNWTIKYLSLCVAFNRKCFKLTNWLTIWESWPLRNMI